MSELTILPKKLQDSIHSLQRYFDEVELKNMVEYLARMAFELGRVDATETLDKKLRNIYRT